MLSENLKIFRKKKGLSQEELALRLNVVRQTVSKWEKGLSVPDSEMLCMISEVLEVPTGTLLGETVAEDESENDAIRALAEKLEIINAQLARRNEQRRKGWRIVWVLTAVLAAASLAIDIAFQIAIEWGAASLGIIGGADGPTSIFITTSLMPFADFIPLILLLVGALIGIYKTKPKHE